MTNKWNIKKPNKVDPDCYVVNCQCDCQPCMLYKAYLRYQKKDPEEEYCLADCANYKGE